MTDERSDLLAQLAACQERLASYIDVVADVVERLGHEGSEPGDLLDALGEIEGMLMGKITSEPHDLTGLAEVCRQALWHRDRARSLLADARNTCDRRAAERDAAILERDAAILERDAAARELVRVLSFEGTQRLIHESHPSDFDAFMWADAAASCGYTIVHVGRSDTDSWMVWCGVPATIDPNEARRTITAKQATLKSGDGTCKP